MNLTAVVVGQYIGLLAGMWIGAAIVRRWYTDDAVEPVATVAPRLREFETPCMN
jgi:hypothetical protein